MPEYVVDNFAKGANNRSRPDRLPAGAARDLLNVVPRSDGGLELRPGAELVILPVAGCRGVLTYKGTLLVLTGDQMMLVDERTMTIRGARQVADYGGLAGAVWNDKLYLTTATEQLVFDGATLRPWGVPDMTGRLAVTAADGQLQPGWYKLAVVFVGVDGTEGGVSDTTLFHCTSGGLQVVIPAPPAGLQARLFCSTVNGSELYEVVTVASGRTQTITRVPADTPELRTLGLRRPTPATKIVAHGAQLVLVDGPYLWLTEPMNPNLISPRDGFLQFPAPVGDVLSVGDTLYVSADKTYAIKSLMAEDGGQQTVALEFSLVPGSGAVLPDGRAVAMTKDGLAVLAADGVDTPSASMYAVNTRERGASGVVDAGGERLVITSQTGAETPNPLARDD